MTRNYKWVPVVDEDICDGCGICVEACGPRCLEIVGGITVLVRPDDCGSEEHCIAVCPHGCIQMAWLPMSGDYSVGNGIPPARD